MRWGHWSAELYNSVKDKKQISSKKHARFHDLPRAQLIWASQICDTLSSSPSLLGVSAPAVLQRSGCIAVRHSAAPLHPAYCCCCCYCLVLSEVAKWPSAKKKKPYHRLFVKWLSWFTTASAELNHKLIPRFLGVTVMSGFQDLSDRNLSRGARLLLDVICRKPRALFSRWEPRSVCLTLVNLLRWTVQVPSLEAEDL